MSLKSGSEINKTILIDSATERQRYVHIVRVVHFLVHIVVKVKDDRHPIQSPYSTRQPLLNHCDGCQVGCRRRPVYGE